MTVARTNNGSKMKTNKEFESTITTALFDTPMTSPLLPSRTVPKPGRRGPFRRRLHQALHLSHPRQFSIRPCVTAPPLIAHPGPALQPVVIQGCCCHRQA
jgi:hypothetical protein